MTFDQWYEDRFGIRVTQAERDNHKQLRHYRDCWGSALSCAKSDHEAALAAKDAAHEAALKAAVAAERAGCVYAAAEGIRDHQHYDGPLNDQYDLLDSEAEKIIAAILARGAAHETN